MVVNSLEPSCIGENGVYLKISKIAHLLGKSDVLKMHFGNVSVQQIISVKDNNKPTGFISQITRLTVILSDGTRIPIIVKIPELHTITHSMVLMCGEEGRYFMRENGSDELYRFIADYFNRECTFYKTLADWEEVKCPTAYSTNTWKYGSPESCGCVIMHDLSSRAAPTNIYQDLTHLQLFQLVSQIAWIQVNSIRQKLETIRFSEGYLEIFHKMGKPASTWTKLEPAMKPYLDAVTHLYENRCFWKFAFNESHRTLEIPDVVCHGDMWTYNFLWNTDDENCGVLEALLDWQNVHHGSCAEDICHLFVFCCDADTRRAAEDELLPLLHQMVADRCLAYGYKVPYSLNQLLHAYRMQLVPQTTHFAFIGRVMDTMDQLDPHEQRHHIIVDRVIEALKDGTEALMDSLPQFVAH